MSAASFESSPASARRSSVSFRPDTKRHMPESDSSPDLPAHAHRSRRQSTDYTTPQHARRRRAPPSDAKTSASTESFSDFQRLLDTPDTVRPSARAVQADIAAAAAAPSPAQPLRTARRVAVSAVSEPIVNIAPDSGKRARAGAAAPVPAPEPVKPAASLAVGHAADVEVAPDKARAARAASAGLPRRAPPAVPSVSHGTSPMRLEPARRMTPASAKRTPKSTHKAGEPAAPAPSPADISPVTGGADHDMDFGDWDGGDAAGDWEADYTPQVTPKMPARRRSVRSASPAQCPSSSDTSPAASPKRPVKRRGATVSGSKGATRPAARKQRSSTSRQRAPSFTSDSSDGQEPGQSTHHASPSPQLPRTPGGGLAPRPQFISPLAARGQAESDALGLRRSSRQRWAPLNWWEGEHIELTRHSEDNISQLLPVVSHAVREGTRGFTESSKRRRPPAKSKPKSSKPSKTGKKRSREEPPAAPTPLPVPDFPRAELPEELDVASDAEMQVPGEDGAPPDVVQLVGHEAYLAWQPYPEEGAIGAELAPLLTGCGLVVGRIRMAAGGSVPASLPYQLPVLLSVLRCQPCAMCVTLEGKTVPMRAGDSMLVPPHCAYDLRNFSSEHVAEIQFTVQQPAASGMAMVEE